MIKISPEPGPNSWLKREWMRQDAERAQLHTFSWDVGSGDADVVVHSTVDDDGVIEIQGVRSSSFNVDYDYSPWTEFYRPYMTDEEFARHFGGRRMGKSRVMRDYAINQLILQYNPDKKGDDDDREVCGSCFGRIDRMLMVSGKIRDDLPLEYSLCGLRDKNGDIVEGTTAVEGMSDRTTARILEGDARVVLAEVESETVQCVVTSPPYLGLRKYGQDEGMIGLETSVDEHIAAIVEVFREVKRVLRKNGVVWLNYGDMYSVKGRQVNNSRGDIHSKWDHHDQTYPDRPDYGVPEKNVVGLPWKLAFALQDDDWVLRDAIIWHKPNPVPESVKDRTTRSHEHIFMLTRSPRYLYHRLGVTELTHEKARKIDRSIRGLRSVWTIPVGGVKDSHFAAYPEEIPRRAILLSSNPGDIVLDPSGTGTTGKITIRYDRHAVLCEIDPESVKVIRRGISRERAQSRMAGV